MRKMENLRPSVRKRFEFIEFQLIWEGAVGRKMLKDQFKISLQQATLDLTAYLDLCPENMHYDPRQRSYVSYSNFKPQFIQGIASEYLLHLEMLYYGYRSQAEIWPTYIPSFDAIAAPSRKINPKVLKTVLAAIKHQICLKTKYVSLSSQSENFRILKPHAIASDGHRWHVRAYDCDNRRYSDFVISRFEEVTPVEHVDADIPPDDVWNNLFELVLQPKPDLSARQKSQMEHEYEMQNGQLRVSVRGAMLFYSLRFYGFDPNKNDDDETMLNKSSFNLEIVNLREVETCLQRR